MKSRSSALSALICSLGPGPGFASDTAFAMQFKAGVKGEVARNLLLFAEYRHLTLNPTQYTFGETLPPHLPTDAWTVSLGRQSYNLFVAWLQVKF